MSRGKKSSPSVRATEVPSGPNSHASPGGRESFPAWVHAVLVGALGLAGYLAYASLMNGGVAGCGAEGGCNEVLQSKWSRWMGIPVAIFAAGAYSLLWWGMFRSMKSMERPLVFPTWIPVLAVTILLGAIWFIGLQAGVIGRFCPLCCTTHALASIASLWTLSKTGLGNTMQTIGSAVAAWGVLAAGQTWGPAKSANSVTSIAAARVEPASNAPSSAPESTRSASTQVAVSSPRPAVSGAPPTPPALPPAILSLHGTNFVYNLARTPVLGNPRAPHVLVSMFDYSCKYCRGLHGPLHEALNAFSNQMVILNLPMPLAAECNPFIRKTSPDHATACDLARLSLAVWKADPARYREYDDWLMESTETRPVLEARSRAESLVGLMRLEASMNDPWITAYLLESARLFRTNQTISRKGNMPMLMIGSNIVSGSLNHPAEIFTLIERGLGLKRTSP